MHLPWRHIALTLVAFLLVWAAIIALGADPAETFRTMISESVEKPQSWRETLLEFTPLLAAGLSVFIALRAGLFNIGAEGQLLVGALATVSVTLANPSPLGMVLGVLAGIVAGALWALPAGLIKAYRGGHEVISTIMLNAIAIFFASWLLRGPLQDKTQQSTTTALIEKSAQLPNIIVEQPFRLNAAVLVVVVIAIGFALWLNKTVKGYELTAVGKGPKAAEAAGVSLSGMIVSSMGWSGALAGLAGALMVVGDQHRVYDGFSGGFGFDGLGVAMLAGSSPYALIPSALLFAIIGQGSDQLSVMGIPKGLNGILLGILIIVFAAYRSRRPKVDG
jgi:simple sugar transport system permease protein